MASTFVCPCVKRNETINIINSFINILNLNKIMDKKELKFYEAPACEMVELSVSASLLAGSVETNPFEDSTGEPEEIE